MKKPKKQTNKQINDKRWDILSKRLRELHPSCEVCGSTKGLQCHHVCCSKFYAKSILRYHTSNILVCCSKCHFMAHKSPLQMMIWMLENRRYDHELCRDILGDIKKNNG